MMSFIAYKAFKRVNGSPNIGQCRDMLYEAGSVYEVSGKPVICEHGLHFCKDLVLTLQYYAVSGCITENLYAEVEVIGDVDYELPTKHKGCTNKLRILRFISDSEVLTLIGDNKNSGHSNSGHSNSGDNNSGNWNSGYSNSGYSNSGYSNSGNSNSGHSNSGYSNSGNSNSGDRNSGHCNSGHSNSGHSNSGNWNSSNFETGCFNSKQSEYINVFNKPCLREVWEQAEKPAFLFFGIAAKETYKEAFQKSFETATTDDIQLLKNLPNFNANVFFEISGITIY